MLSFLPWRRPWTVVQLADIMREGVADMPRWKRKRFYREAGRVKRGDLLRAYYRKAMP